MEIVFIIAALAVGLLIGGIGQYLINKFGLKAKRERIIDDARKEAEVIKKNKLFDLLLKDKVVVCVRVGIFLTLIGVLL